MKFWEHIKGDYIETSPFTFKGRLHNWHYICYLILFNLIYYTCSNRHAFSNWVLIWVTIILHLFVVKRRIYDITLSNKKAWIFSVSYFAVAIVSGLIWPWLQILLWIPSLIILFAPPNKLTIEEYEQMQKEKNSISVFAKPEGEINEN